LFGCLYLFFVANTTSGHHGEDHSSRKQVESPGQPALRRDCRSTGIVGSIRWERHWR
jgi:hypothetical protein